MHAEAVARINHEFARSWSFDEGDLNRPHADQVVRDLIARHAAGGDPRLNLEYFGAGPLEALLTDPAVTEILVDGSDTVWCERGGRLSPHPDRFLSELTFRNFVDRVLTETGIKVDLTQPFGDGTWRGFRLHVARAPLSRSAFHLTLRRTPESPWTLSALRDADWCDDHAVAVLDALITDRRNVMIVGPTGSGKTSVLNALLRRLGDHERAVILEDTDELRAPNAASTKLLTRVAVGQHLPEVNLGELLRQSLRMRPDRLVVGEVRGAEAKDLLMALSTGHAGSFGTLHAASARQALLRLEMLTQLGAPQWGLGAIRRLIHLSVDALITCDFKGGRRSLGGIARVAGVEDFGLLLEDLV